MSAEMDKQNRRAGRILRRFAGYASEAAAQSSLDTPTIARTKPRTYARIKRSVAWRLMAKGRK